MKKFFNAFFVTLGVIFFIMIIAGALFFTIDPYNIKPLIFGSGSTASESSESSQSDKNPALNETQKKALETFGIDSSVDPSSITPEQEQCFVEILGQARVNEIKAGGTPTASEYFQAKGCL